MIFGSNVNARKKEVLAGLKDGMTVADAAKIAGVSERSIRAWARYAGIKIADPETQKAEKPEKPMSASQAKKLFG